MREFGPALPAAHANHQVCNRCDVTQTGSLRIGRPQAKGQTERLSDTGIQCIDTPLPLFGDCFCIPSARERGVESPQVEHPKHQHGAVSIELSRTLKVVMERTDRMMQGQPTQQVHPCHPLRLDPSKLGRPHDPRGLRLHRTRHLQRSDRSRTRALHDDDRS